jgi:hypothetical protein
MGRGRRRTRTGEETQSTFEKTPALDIAILDLQRRYLETGRGKPTMRDLLIEGITILLEREALPRMSEPRPATAPTVIKIPKRSGA